MHSVLHSAFPSRSESHGLSALKKKRTRIDVLKCGCVHFSNAAARVEKKTSKKTLSLRWRARCGSLRIGLEAVERHIQQQHIHPRLAEKPPLRRLNKSLHQLIDFVLAQSARGGDAGDLKRAASGLICGSKPLAEAKTMSAGTTVLVGRLFPLMKAAMLFMTLVCRAPLVGPRLLPLDAVMPVGPVP